MLETIGKYKIKRELGKGAMGVVFEGVDPFIERAVAIKVIKKSDLDGVSEQDILSRFLREAQAAGRLTHSNIVSVYEYGEDGDTAFIAMEYVEGADLKKYLDDEHHFSVEEAINITCQLLEALDYSHRSGVIHRDIKPSNVIITSAKQVKVADFGIAKLESSQLTQVGTMMGTPAYMSPEQIQDFATDNRVDLYAAGVIFYELLTGMRPFSGSPITIMHQVVHVEPKHPHLVNPSIPEVLDKVVAKAMAKQPGDRYQTARDFINALNVIRESGCLVEEIDQDATRVLSKPVNVESSNFTLQVSEQPKQAGAIYPKDNMTEFFTSTATAMRAESPLKESSNNSVISTASQTSNRTLIITFLVLAVVLIGLVSAFFIKLSHDKNQEILLQQMAAQKAELERAAKQEAEKIAAQKAEEERVAAEKAEAENIAAKRLEEERAEKEKLALEKGSLEKALATKLAAERAAAKKAAEEKAALKAKELEREALAAQERSLAAELAAEEEKKKMKSQASSKKCQFYCNDKK